MDRTPTLNPKVNGQDAVARRTVLIFAGYLILLLGSALAAAGLIGRGSPYYLLAGLGLGASGFLIARQSRVGAWIYMGVFVLTLAFALRGVAHGGTPIAMRLIGPIVLLAMIALVMPALRGWRVRRTVITFGAILLVTLGVTVAAIAKPLAERTAAATRFLGAR